MSKASDLTKAFEAIRKLPYVPTRLGRRFEEDVSEILRKVAKMEDKDKPEGDHEEKETRFASWDESKEWGFVSEPNGSQQAPDKVLFLFGHGRLPVEIKRSNTGSSMWNSGHPRCETLYIYNGKGSKGSGTTFVLGSDLISPEEIADLDVLKKEFLNWKKDFDSTLKGRWGLSHIRPMFKERGAGSQWLDHPERAQREQRVFQYLTNRLGIAGNI